MTHFRRICMTVLGTMVVVGSVTADQQILDDLIVDGSVCAGQDCVNGESFGFDTLRLKENNLRIGFQDTSNSASFPSNDWELTANDSSNGGQNKFSITDISGGRTPFTVEASAPTASLYVDDGGRIGVGTATPVVELHVVNGDSPTLRLEQDGSSGFQAQTWDIASNETNFFIRDASNGSTLPFRIRPGAPTSSVDIQANGSILFGGQSASAAKVLIDSAGNLGVGIGAPDANAAAHISSSDGTGGLIVEETNVVSDNNKDILILRNNGSAKIQMENTSPDGENWEIGATDASFIISQNGTGGSEFRITDAGSLVFGQGALSVFSVNGTTGVVQVNGSQVHPDFVFAEDYDLPSIEDQAKFMWENSHLPSLPKAPEGLKGPVNLLGHQMGILEEVEKAHIYIDQLNKKMAQLEAKLAEYEAVK